MRIALGLGKSLREVEALDADEVLWWEAMYEIDPWDARRDDLRIAMLCQLVASFTREPPELAVFMPYDDKWNQPRAPLRPETIHNVMMDAQAWMNNGNNRR